MRRAASAVAIAIGVAAVCTCLAGCTAPKPEPVPPAPTLLVASTPSPSHPSTVPLGTVNFSGTGSETLTVRVPNGSAYLNSNWECSSDGTVTLVEDPGVFEGIHRRAVGHGADGDQDHLGAEMTRRAVGVRHRH